MVKKVVSLALAVVIGFGFGIGAGIDASADTSLATAYINDKVKIEVNGKRFVPVDNGEKMDILIYNNRIYLPLRSLGEAIDADIDWDQEKQTAVVKTHW